VSPQGEGIDFAQREHMLFMETSAQSAHNVEEAFNEVTKTIFHSIHKDLTDDEPHEDDPLSDKKKIKISDGHEEITTVPQTKPGCCGRSM